MTEVYCDYDCKHSKDGICSREAIRIDHYGCEDYEEIKESNLPDKYYRYCIDNKTDKHYWQEASGIKTVINGRDIFDAWGTWTDGRTGIACGDKNKNVFTIRTNDWKDFLVEIEAKIEELSPLYNPNPTLEIRPMKD